MISLADPERIAGLVIEIGPEDIKRMARCVGERLIGHSAPKDCRMPGCALYISLTRSVCCSASAPVNEVEQLGRRLVLAGLTCILVQFFQLLEDIFMG